MPPCYGEVKGVQSPRLKIIGLYVTANMIGCAQSLDRRISRAGSDP